MGVDPVGHLTLELTAFDERVSINVPRKGLASWICLYVDSYIYYRLLKLLS